MDTCHYFPKWPILALVTFLFVFVEVARANVCDSRPRLKLNDGYESYGTEHLQDEVKELQLILNDKGGYGLSVDGYFGPNTESAVKQYQGANGIEVDGIVGPNTWGSLCNGTQSNLGTCDVNNPNDASSSSTEWTARMKFVVDSLYECFPQKFTCRGQHRNDPDSDHYTGNAADCTPGSHGVKATGKDKEDGDALADWLIQNAASLRVQYVIWYMQIWNIDRADEGWRICGTSSATCYGGADITSAHYDHVHISMQN